MIFTKIRNRNMRREEFEITSEKVAISRKM